MRTAKSILNSPYFIWILLSLPALGLIADLFEPARRYGALMHHSGEYSARFLVLSLIITPLMLLSGGKGWARWLLRRRRYFGVAAFGYAMLHTIFYLRQESLAGALAEWADIGILTGWLAFVIFVPLAMTSNNPSVRALGPRWKQLQRWVYGAAVFTFLHWGFVAEWGPAIVHAVPVVALTLYRFWHRSRAAKQRVAVPKEGVTGSTPA